MFLANNVIHLTTKVIPFLKIYIALTVPFTQTPVGAVS